MINTRKDLDSIVGTKQHEDFIKYLKGSMTKRVNTAVYPEDYDNTLQDEDVGYVAPIIEEIEDLSIIQRYEFTKEELLNL